MSDAGKLGKRRQAVHKDSSNPRINKDDPGYEHNTGAPGEEFFEKEFGYPLDERDHVGGDSGYDFVTAIGFIDVKTTSFHTPALNVKTYEIDRPVDIYVLAFRNKVTKVVNFLGWELQEPMKSAPIVQVYYGQLVPCYQKLPGELKPMDSFRRFLDYYEKIKRPELTAKLKAGSWPDVIDIYKDFKNGKI